MLVSAFLTGVDDMYPNGFTDAQKIGWMNEAIYKVYKDIGMDDYSDVTTVADQSIYAFPTYVEPELIKAMTVSLSSEDADELHYQRHLNPLALNDPLKVNGWAKVDEDYFIIYPEPTESGQVIRIYHQLKPPEYASTDTAEDLEDYLRRDYLLVLRYDVLHTMAVANDDIIKANNFGVLYNEEFLRVRRQKWQKAGKYPRTVDTMKANSRQRRYGRRIYYVSGDS